LLRAATRVGGRWRGSYLFLGRQLEQSTVKKSRTKKERLPPQTSEADVEVWNDPVWQPALEAFEGWTKDGNYTGKSDPKKLAKLLRSGKPVPEAVAVQLGVLLDPPWEKKARA
jgi:hypothetical protein